MWVLLKDFLLVSMGMGIGVVLMCILNVGKEADYEMKQLKERREQPPFLSTVLVLPEQHNVYSERLANTPSFHLLVIYILKKLSFLQSPLGAIPNMFK